MKDQKKERAIADVLAFHDRIGTPKHAAEIRAGHFGFGFKKKEAIRDAQRIAKEKLAAGEIKEATALQFMSYVWSGEEVWLVRLWGSYDEDLMCLGLEVGSDFVSEGDFLTVPPKQIKKMINRIPHEDFAQFL